MPVGIAIVKAAVKKKLCVLGLGKKGLYYFVYLVRGYVRIGIYEMGTAAPSSPNDTVLRNLAFLSQYHIERYTYAEKPTALKAYFKDRDWSIFEPTQSNMYIANIGLLNNL